MCSACKKNSCVNSQLRYSRVVAGTDVAATTIHALLDLNPDTESKLDFTKGNPKTAALMSLDVLFIDEAGPVSNYS